MSLNSYLNIIKELILNSYNAFKVPPNFERQLELLEKMESDKLYIENVRSLFNISFENAKFLCDSGVKEGIFTKRIGLLCPNEDCSRILLSINEKQEIPNEISCDGCEDMERDRSHFNSDELKQIIYYKFANTE